MKKISLIMIMMAATLFAQDELKLLTAVHGEKDGDAFSVVDAIGDVNGDGYDDFIVGKSNSGEYVKLYFGGSPFDTLDCIKFLHVTRKAMYASGCGKGDLNGDGYNDFVINTAYDVNDYRVEIYYGGKDKKIYDNPDLTITNNGWYYNFGGRSISGDLNGDGYDDLVISAPMDDYDARGRVYIYFGGKDMDSNVDVYLEGKEGRDMFGESVSIVGDVNGDGFDDLLVGAPQDLKGKGGKAYLFWGGKNIGFNNTIEFLGDTTLAYNSYGRIVSGLGDINGDGFDDFGILSIGYIDIFSGKTLEVILKPKYNDKTKDFWFIGGLSDLDNDGYYEYTYVNNQINFEFGKNIPDTIPRLHLDYWGMPILNVGDINGDKKFDIAVGRSYGEKSQGTVLIYSYGKLDGIEETKESEFPIDFKLNQNYPNPFNPETTISYKLQTPGYITLKVYDILGREIETLVDEYQSVGTYKVIFNGQRTTNHQQLASGIYFYQLRANDPSSGSRWCFMQIKKMMLLK